MTANSNGLNDGATNRQPEHILVAVAWPYASGPRHLGHAAGAYVPPDIFARYHRMAGNNVLMVSGSDMHGTPITVAAEKLRACHRVSWRRRTTPIIADYFARLGSAMTSTPTHADTDSLPGDPGLLLKLLDKGYLFRPTRAAPCSTRK